MDRRACTVCGEWFDFDTVGLEGPFGIYCSPQCTKKCCEARGVKYVIHDEAGGVVETNTDGSETLHHWPAPHLDPLFEN